MNQLHKEKFTLDGNVCSIRVEDSITTTATCAVHLDLSCIPTRFDEGENNPFATPPRDRVPRKSGRKEDQPILSLNTRGRSNWSPRPTIESRVHMARLARCGRIRVSSLHLAYPAAVRANIGRTWNFRVYFKRFIWLGRYVPRSNFDLYDAYSRATAVCAPARKKRTR